MQNLSEYIKDTEKTTSKSNFSFYLFCAFFVFALFNPYFQKYDYGAGLPVVMLFSGLVLAFYFADAWGNRERATAEKVFLTIFGITYIIAYIYSSTINLSFPETIAFLSMIPFYLIFAHKKLQFGRPLLSFLAVCGFLATVEGYIFYILLEPTRMTGPFFPLPSPSHLLSKTFGSFLLMIWPIYLIVFNKKWSWHHYFILSFVLSGLLLTFSRGALIAFFGQMVLLGIYFIRRINLKLILKGFIVAALSVFLFMSINYMRGLSSIVIDVGKRISFENNEVLTSGQERSDFWVGAIKLIKEKPLTGYGPFSFRYAFNPIQKIFLGSSDHPHNIFLKFGAENGLLNMFSFIAFLFSIFVLYIIRRKQLTQASNDFVVILGVAVLGVLAHSMIDYNFNFFQTLVLLFILLILIRSELIVKEGKKSLSFLALIFSLLVFFACVYQFSIIFLSGSGILPAVSDYSLYPRYTYLESADKLLSEDKFEESLSALEKELSLNSLDAQAYYLKGVIYCNKKFEGYDTSICKDNYKSALELNPKNNIIYYRDYLRIAEQLKAPERIELRKECLDLFNLYFGYTKFNVHFTAYTPQVEAAVEMADILLPNLDKETAKEVREKQVLMLVYAKEHRGGKTF